MPKAFLSHCSKDKKIVLEVMDYFERSLIKTWLDEEEIPGGGKLTEEIISGINDCKYFLPFISNYFIDSSWCMDELNVAYSSFQKEKNVIIPVLLTERGKLELDSLADGKKRFIQSLLQRTRYVEFDEHDVLKSLKRIADALWKNELVKFDPIEVITINDIDLQLINFQIENLPSDFLKFWDFDMNDFIGQRHGEQPVIKRNLPVAFNGKGPNWLFSYFTIPFKNLNDVFLYNNVSGDYICVYSLKRDWLGKVLKPE
jgi:hypothetical protein